VELFAMDPLRPQAQAAAVKVAGASDTVAATDPGTNGASTFVESETSVNSWDSYHRKISSQVHLVQCALIVGKSPSGTQEAILDCSTQLLFYCGAAECGELPGETILSEPLSDFEKRFHSWQIVQLPKSAEQSMCILERCQSALKGQVPAAYCNKHFARWCFSTQTESQTLSREQLLYHGANVATSLKTGIAAGLSAAWSTTSVTVTTPVYILGMIPWGSSASTIVVPLMSTTAAVGLGAAVFAGGVAVGLAMSSAVNWYAARFNAKLSQSLPICVYNRGDKVRLQLRSIQSSSSCSAGCDNIVHGVRAYCGAGCRSLVLMNGAVGELNPPCEEANVAQFLLRAFVDGELKDSVEVRRGDVVVNEDGVLRRILDPELVETPDSKAD